MAFTGQLRPFQKEAHDRIIDRNTMLLALPMGTGKTVTSLAAIETLMDSGVITEPGIILAGASLKYQWESEIKKFTNSRSVVVSGTPAQRRKIYEDFWNWDTTGIDYLIVTYETMSNDANYFAQLPRGFVIADEVVALKGFRAKRTQRAKKLFRKTPVKIGLSGTPIENGKPEELFCVDEKTQALSQRGWLSYTELTTQDRVLTLNHETGRSEWQTVQAVNVFPVQGQEMVLMEHRDHSSLTTPSHRWPVERRSYRGGVRMPDQRVWATTETLKRRDFVPVAVPCSDLPTEPVHPDALVELVAWVYTEGHIRKLRNGSPGTAVNIAQNEGSGKKRVAEALFDFFGEESPFFPRLGGGGDFVPRWRSDKSGFKLNTVAGALLLAHAPGKVPSHEFLLSLTAAQLYLFIEVSMLADNNGSYHFSQKNPAHAEAFQFACTLAGFGTSLRVHSKVDLDRAGNPYQMTAVTVRRRDFFGPAYADKTSIQHTGYVWCPTTPNGSWLARREGTTYFTGNSIMEFLDPTVLGRFDMFDRTFIERNSKGWVEGYKNLGTLHRAMQPAMVRKSYDDPDISEALPTEIVRDPLLIDLDSRTASLMRRITRDLKADLVTLSNTPGGQTFSLSDHYGHSDAPNSQWSEADVLRGLLMSKIVTARMLCDHPDLVRHSAYLYGQEDGGSAYAAQLVEAGHLDMVTASPKLDVLAERLEDILSDPDSKVVVFSVFRGMLDLIQRRMSSVGSVVYHGGMNAEKRNEAKIQFQTDPDTRIFISSDAGGYGVDLPQANALINYDLPWAAGALDQRNARPRRVSSTWEHIVIENLMIKDSLEEWQFGLLAHKTAVSQAILAGRGITESGGVSVPLDSLLTHLSRTPAVSNK